jgi:hypothetical protein
VRLVDRQDQNQGCNFIFFTYKKTKKQTRKKNKVSMKNMPQGDWHCEVEFRVQIAPTQRLQRLQGIDKSSPLQRVLLHEVVVSTAMQKKF